MNSDYLFVYGTLRKDVDCTKNKMLFPYCSFFEYGMFRGRLFEINNYPGIVTAKQGYSIKGEIYSIHEANLLFSILDEYEACSNSFPEPHEYERQIVNIITEKNILLECWAYVYAWDTIHCEEILTGDYAQYAEVKKSN